MSFRRTRCQTQRKATEVLWSCISEADEEPDTHQSIAYSIKSEYEYGHKDLSYSQRSRSISQYRRNDVVILVEALAAPVCKSMGWAFQELLNHTYREHRFQLREIDTVATDIIIPFIGKDIRRRREAVTERRNILRNSENISVNLMDWDKLSSSGGNFRKSVCFGNQSSTQVSACKSLYSSVSKTDNPRLAIRVILRHVGKLVKKHTFNTIAQISNRKRCVEKLGMILSIKLNRKEQQTFRLLKQQWSFAKSLQHFCNLAQRIHSKLTNIAKSFAIFQLKNVVFAFKRRNRISGAYRIFKSLQMKRIKSTYPYFELIKQFSIQVRNRFRTEKTKCFEQQLVKSEIIQIYCNQDQHSVYSSTAVNFYPKIEQPLYIQTNFPAQKYSIQLLPLIPNRLKDCFS